MTRLIGAQMLQSTSKKCSAISEHENPRSHTVRQMMNFPVKMGMPDQTFRADSRSCFRFVFD